MATSTSAISTTKCLVISIALHLVIFAQLSGNGIGYHTGKANQYNSLSTQASLVSLMSVEYIPIYSQITPKFSTFNKRDNVPKQKAIIDNDKKMPLQTIRQYTKSSDISETQDSILVPLPQHINMRYDSPSLTYGKSLLYERNSINPIRMKGNAKPIQLISSKALPVSKGLSEMQTDETQKPNISTKIESENDSEHYVLVRSWPEKPPKQDFWGVPSKFAVDNSGNIYVSSGKNVIMKFSSDGKLLKKWGEKGSNDGQFRAPAGIAVDSLGNVYVADCDNFRIQKFGPDGNFLAKFGKKSYGDVKYNEPNAMKHPVDVAVDKKGNVYVVDSGSNCVNVYDSDGVWRFRWGERGSRDGQFRFPTCVAVDNQGNVYVADDQNRRIQKFKSNGEFLCKKSSSGSRAGSIRLTSGMVADDLGNLFVVDAMSRYVQKLDAQNMLMRITGWGQISANYDYFWKVERKPEPYDGFILPSDIAIDKDGNVYVLDSWRIKIFRPASK